ncbi:MAG: hypothetical protein AAF845_18655 [Bacteroidota bacterium]
MGILYVLANRSRREKLSFEHLGLGKRSEWILNRPAASAATLYLIDCTGDDVAFVDDIGGWPFEGPHDDLGTYRNVTREVLEKMVALDLVRDRDPDSFVDHWAPPTSTTQ